MIIYLILDRTVDRLGIPLLHRSHFEYITVDNHFAFDVAITVRIFADLTSDHTDSHSTG